MNKERHGTLWSLGLGFGGALLGWVLATGMFVAYLIAAFTYDQYPQIDCSGHEPPTLMWVLGLLMLVAMMVAPVGATYLGAKVWRANLRPALLLAAFFLAPLLVTWLLAILWVNRVAIVGGCEG